MGCLVLQSQNILLTPSLPLEVCLQNSAITLFSRIFPRLSAKHREESIAFYAIHVSKTKASQLPGLLHNVITTLITSFTLLYEEKESLALATVMKTKEVLLVSVIYI